MKKNCVRENLSEVEKWIEFMEKEFNEDLRGKEITFSYSLERCHIEINGKTTLEGDYRDSLMGEVPSKNYYQENIKGVERLKLRGYNVKYSGPESIEDFYFSEQVIEEFDKDWNLDLAVIRAKNMFASEGKTIPEKYI